MQKGLPPRSYTFGSLWIQDSMPSAVHPEFSEETSISELCLCDEAQCRVWANLCSSVKKKPRQLRKFSRLWLGWRQHYRLLVHSLFPRKTCKPPSNTERTQETMIKGIPLHSSKPICGTARCRMVLTLKGCIISENDYKFTEEKSRDATCKSAGPWTATFVRLWEHHWEAASTPALQLSAPTSLKLESEVDRPWPQPKLLLLLLLS